MCGAFFVSLFGRRIIECVEGVSMPRILVVDDSLFLAGKIKTHLEKLGHEVVGIAEDGVQAVEMYKEYKPALFTLDITMPNKDGHDTLIEIMNFDSTAKAVIISAIDDKKMIVNCLNLGAKGFIEKPLKFNNDDFCTKFQDTLNEALH